MAPPPKEQHHMSHPPFPFQLSFQTHQKRQVGFKFRVLLGLGEPTHSLSKRWLHVVHSILILPKNPFFPRWTDAWTHQEEDSAVAKWKFEVVPIFSVSIGNDWNVITQQDLFGSWEKSLCCGQVGPSQSQHLGWFCYLTHQVSQVSYKAAKPSEVLRVSKGKTRRPVFIKFFKAMNFFKTSTLGPPCDLVIFWNKNFQVGRATKGPPASTSRCFQISKFKSVSCSGKARVSW